MKIEFTTNGKKNRKSMKFYISGTVLAGVLLFGSASISPTINNVFAKTPFLNLIYEPTLLNKDIVKIITERLISKNYPFENVSIVAPKKNIVINIDKSEQNPLKVEKAIEKEVNSLLSSFDLTDYKLEIVQDLQSVSLNTMIYQETNLMAKQLQNNIKNDARLQDYKLISVSVNNNDVQNMIILVASDKETRTGVMQKIVQSIVKENNFEPYLIKTYSIDAQEEEIALKWQAIINKINTEFIGKDEMKIKDIRYSLFEPPSSFLINTSINSTDVTAIEEAQKIEKSIRMFITTHGDASSINQEPYNIVIYGSDNKKINIATQN
ncbi:DUF4030 domain-containing protein [Viridibacillus arvi]|uniref:DUF4030 domain-containing protein n=1 Tax=Viridibacillus arvi TaxID=263475 RepID=UPI00187B7F38|nr:DUF4030 domain-containing protein [Viridibacillus sp. JNUCC-6]QOV12403.1 DUF4030 domain-containing protein [Viridibacillus sp. JNUCC-6]